MICMLKSEYKKELIFAYNKGLKKAIEIMSNNLKRTTCPNSEDGLPKTYFFDVGNDACKTETIYGNRSVVRDWAYIVADKINKSQKRS